MPKPAPDYDGIHGWVKAAVDFAHELRAAGREASACECIYSCADDPPTACSLSGQWHVHPGEPCPVHPDAPGDR